MCLRGSVHSYDYVLEPSPVALPLAQPQSTRVVQVTCGRAHSLVLTDREGGEPRPFHMRGGNDVECIIWILQ